MNHYFLFATPIGHCGIAWRDDVVIASHLPGKDATTTAAQIARRAEAELGQPPMSIKHAIEQITQLLEGGQTDLTQIDCDFSQLNLFAQSVLAATRMIPAGQTKTYGEIAEELGDKQKAQQVGRALGHNPIPIIVPCHRVIGANNKLVGFSAPGGLDLKLKMLLIEGARFGNEPGLFDDMPMPIRPEK